MISTEYRGYTVQYSENADLWNCPDCGIVDQPTLSKVKERINAMHLKLRKASAMPCFEIAGEVTYSGAKVRALEGTIIEYIGPKKARYGYPEETHSVAVVSQRPNRDAKSRQEVYLQNLAPDTPEVRAQIAAADALGQIAHEAAEAFRAAVRAIPRVQIEDIADLIKASGHTFQEGEE